MPCILYGSITPHHPPSPPPSSNPTDPPRKIPEAKYGMYAGGVKGTFPHTKTTSTSSNADPTTPHVKYSWNSTQHTSAYETPQLEGAYTSFPEPETWYLAEELLPVGVPESSRGNYGGKGAGKGGTEGKGVGEDRGEGDRDEEAEEGREWMSIRRTREPRFIEKA